MDNEPAEETVKEMLARHELLLHKISSDLATIMSNQGVIDKNITDSTTGVKKEISKVESLCIGISKISLDTLDNSAISGV